MKKAIKLIKIKNMHFIKFLILWIFFANIEAQNLCANDYGPLKKDYGSLVYEYKRAQVENKLGEKGYKLPFIGFMTYLNENLQSALEEGNVPRAEKLGKYMIGHMISGKPIKLNKERSPDDDEMTAVFKGLFLTTKAMHLADQDLKFFIKSALGEIDSKDLLNSPQSSYVFWTIALFDTLGDKGLKNFEFQSTEDIKKIVLKKYNHDDEDTLNAMLKGFSSLYRDIKFPFEKYKKKKQNPKENSGYYRDIANDIEFKREETEGDGLCYFHSMTQKYANQKCSKSYILDLVDELKGEKLQKAKEIVANMLIDRLKVKEPKENDYPINEYNNLREAYDKFQKLRKKLNKESKGFQQLDQMINEGIVSDENLIKESAMDFMSEKGAKDTSTLKNIVQFELENLKYQNAPSDSNIAGLFAQMLDKNVIVFTDPREEKLDNNVLEIPQECRQYIVDAENADYIYLHLSQSGRGSHFTRLKPLKNMVDPRVVYE